MFIGNYGRTFAYAAGKLGIEGTVILPDTAPDNRAEIIKSMGLAVLRRPTAKLMEGIREVLISIAFIWTCKIV